MDRVNHRMPLRVVCATRLRKDRFLFDSQLGRSIKAFINISNVEVRLYSENNQGLSKLYNKAIEEARENPAILIFVHDDIFITDFFWEKRIREGLHNFNIVGLAGNIRRLPRQPSWAFINEQLQWDDRSNLSGTVGHGVEFPPLNLLPYGPTGLECKLLDGCLLAAKSETLLESGLRFDENFNFHFYDLDLCRSAEKNGLKMGTIPLSVIHSSVGNFRGDDWAGSYKMYLEKWGS